MKIRYYNALILKDAFSAPVQGEVWTEGDRITKILPGGEPHPQFDREIDCEGMQAVPLQRHRSWSCLHRLSLKKRVSHSHHSG